MKPRVVFSAGEAAGLLGVSIVKVLRWAHEGKIPCRIEDGQPVFLQPEILDWAAERGLALPCGSGSLDASPGTRDLRPGLVQAVEAGGIHFGLDGNDIVRVLSNAVDVLPFSPEMKKGLLEALLDREEAASTGLGRGVAVPHPRRALALGLSEPMVPVFFLRHPVDYGAIDGRPVSVLFMMFSPSISVHLDLLRRLSSLLRKDEFLSALHAVKTREELLSLIETGSPGCPELAP